MRMTSGKGGKWWEVSPTLINFGMRIQREKEQKKKGTKNEGKKGGEKKMEIFSVFRRSNLDGPRVKVDPHNEG